MGHYAEWVKGVIHRPDYFGPEHAARMRVYAIDAGVSYGEDYGAAAWYNRRGDR